MGNLTKTNWIAGWTPSADSTNGSSEGLLRMDNLHQEEDGCLTLVRGIQKIGSVLVGAVENFYSRNSDSTELTYVGTDNFSVYKMTNVGAPALITSGNDHTAFGDAYGQTLIAAGTTKKRDNAGTLVDLGITKPSTPPTITAINQPKKDLSTGTWSTIEGHDGTVAGVSYQLFSDATTLQLAMEMDLGSAINTTFMGDSGPYDLSQDTFTMLIQCHDKALFTKVRVQLMVDATNYYWKEWDIANDSSVNQSVNAQSVISCKRGEFTREGADGTDNWDSITKVRVTASTISDTYLLAGEQQFLGGVKGALNGFYKYMTVAVSNNGAYLGKSPKSDDSEIVYASNAYITVAAGSSPTASVTEYWIFRRSVILQPETSLRQSHLDKWYRVGTTTGAAFDDTVTDNDAIELNITFNERIQSVGDLTDSILSMEGMYNERMIYMTFKEVILSDRLNPDAYDPNQVLRISGDTSEKNLWIKKVTNSTLILATTKDLYEISGTLLDLPDGSIDVYIRPIGEAFPPLGLRVASEGGVLFYVAKDGIRGTTGSNSTLISPQLTLLFQSETRHGVPAVSVIPGSVGDYALAVGRNKLYAAVPCEDGSRRLLIYSLISKTWRLQFTDPTAIGCTTTGRILVGYGGGSGNFVRELEKDTGVDGSGGLPFTFLTVFDANGQPRNRKDTFTLKLVMDTGGVAVTVALSKDNGSFSNLTLSSQSGQTYYYALDGVTLGFRYALRITDAAGAQVTFKLYEYTIEYDARPEQMDYLRIPNANMGTISRKRFVAFAFVVDSLGSDITFTPYVDNVSGVTSTVNKNGKLTFIHYFTSETIGTDIGGILSGGVFEFYGLNMEESVSEKLPTPVEYLVIPANDYGSPNRKRHTSYKFQINTRNSNVRFTPHIDGSNYTPTTVLSTEKRTVEHFFDPDVDIIGIDIGGVLESISSPKVPFEFYGTIVPQELEVLPPRLDSYYIPVNNFGVAARKRIRTIPLVLDTRGLNCTFTPVVDGSALTPTTFNTNRKQTVYHYFVTDVFGTDFQGILKGVGFEFYGFGNPENVETLPVPKKYDQLQPMRFDKIGKLFAIRVRLVAPIGLTSMPFTIDGEAQSSMPNYAGALYSGSFSVVEGVDDVYHIDMPKSVNGTVFRIILGPTSTEFHRYDLQAKVAARGMESDSRWIPVR